MRHFWVDRITELELGVRAVGLKTVSLSEDVLHDHFPGNPVFPGVLLLEGMAQTAGVLLADSSGGTKVAIMVSLDRARFSAFARPGDVVRFAVEIDSQNDDGARVLSGQRHEAHRHYILLSECTVLGLLQGD